MDATLRGQSSKEPETTQKGKKNTIILSSNAISMTVAGKQNTMRQQKRDGNQKAQKQCETWAATVNMGRHNNNVKPGKC